MDEIHMNGAVQSLPRLEQEKLRRMLVSPWHPPGNIDHYYGQSGTAFVPSQYKTHFIGHISDHSDEEHTMDARPPIATNHRPSARIHIGEESAMPADRGLREITEHYDIHSNMPKSVHNAGDNSVKDTIKDVVPAAPKQDNTGGDHPVLMSKKQWEETHTSGDDVLHVRHHLPSASISVFDNSLIKLPRSDKTVPIEFGKAEWKTSLESLTKAVDFEEHDEELKSQTPPPDYTEQ